MYRLLIVEDEKWEREGLRDFIDWSSLGIEVVGLACNGVEGLTLSEQTHPDIILTDIRMPKMDGINMSKKIRSFLPNAKIIILSGYNDFGYAKQTFEFRAFDYVLKPVDKNSIQDVVIRAISALDREQSNEIEEFTLKSKLMDYLSENKNSLLLKILEGNELELAQESFPVRLSYPKAKIVIALLTMKSASPIDSRIITDRFEAIMKERGMAFSFIKPLKEAVLCLEAPDTQEELSDILQALAGYLKAELNIDSIISVGEAVSGFSEAAVSYSQAREAYSYRFLAQYGDILLYNEVKEKNYMNLDFARPIVIRAHDVINKLMAATQKNQREEWRFLLDSFLATLREISPLSKLMLSKFFTQAMLIINPAVFSVNSENLKSFILDKGRFEEQISKMDTFEQTKDYLMGFLEAISSNTMNKSGNTDAEVTHRVIKIIEERYSEELDLKCISQVIHLTPYYIGSIFKKNTGKTFNQYLCDYRIDRAKEILQTGKVNISRLSEAVGIKNTSYFCSLFKNRFGISPGDYKEIMKGGH